MNSQQLAIALVHHPVVDRNRSVITTAVTNLDLHDIARTARTYEVGRFYVVTPVAEQQRLVKRITGHWQHGYGAGYNPDRKEALERIELSASLDEALAHWREEVAPCPVRPFLTGATHQDGWTYERVRRLMENESLFLVFGTGWGLAPELFGRGWPILEAVRGPGDYNHLPVRAAAAVVLDRLRGLQS